MSAKSLAQQLNQILRNLEKAEKDTQEAVRSAVYLEFVSIMQASLRQVPVDTGRLRSTAYVTMPSYTGEIKIEAGYATNYAGYVHENEHARHNPPTKSHYLSDPFHDAIGGMADRIAVRARTLRESGRPSVRRALFPTSPRPISKDVPRVRVKGSSRKTRRSSRKKGGK